MLKNHKSTLGCVLPLGRPRSVYKNDVERHFLETWFKMSKWPWMSKLMIPVCNTSQENLKKHIWSKFGDSSSNPVISSYLDCADKPNFLEFWVEMAIMTSKVKVNDPYFQNQPRVSQDACLVQSWWFYLKSLMSFRVDKGKSRADGRTDRRTDRRRQRQYPVGLKGQEVKNLWFTWTKFTSIRKVG